MKKITTILSTTLIIFAIGTSSLHAENSYMSWLFSMDRMKEIEPMTDKVYNEECSGCHMAYQPGLLPEASWRKLLTANALEDHFGENAELDEETLTHILKVAITYSADHSYYKRSKKVMSSLSDNQSPLRIIDVPYIKEKHHEVMEELVGKNKKVKSLSFCNKCHRQTSEGSYDDDTVLIPRQGYWTW